jgi:gliding motility-associated-like protein
VQKLFTGILLCSLFFLLPEDISAQKPELGNDTVICNYNPFTINAGAGYLSYLWSNGSTNQSITTVVSGEFWVEVVDAGSNTHRDTINVVLSIPPYPNFGFTDACRNSDVFFMDATTYLLDSINRWFWDFGNGDSDTVKNPVYAFPTAGNFIVTLTATNFHGCDSSYSDTITIYPLPVAFAGFDQFVNRGDTVFLNGGASPGNYLWQPNFFLNFDNIINPRCIPTGTITYELTVTDALGCINRDSVTIFVNQPPVAIDRVGSINANSNISFPEENISTDQDGNPLTITIISGPFYGTAIVHNDTIIYTPSTNYSGNDTIVFQVCDNGNPPLCDQGIIIINVGNIAPLAQTDSASTEVNTDASFNVMVNDTEYNSTQTIVIDFISVPPNGTVIDNNNGNLVYTPDFNFVGTDSFFYIICDNGQPILCDTGWVYVTVTIIPLFINNSFSPNGDGLFDFFIIEGIKSYPESELNIFNRWGEVIFKAKGYQNNWDGFTGFKEEVPEATYYYHLDLKDGSKPFTGYIVLKR